MVNSEASRLVLRKDVAELKRLAGWIEGFTQERTSPDVSFAVQLCLEEAVANIIMYGARRDDPLEIAVELERNGENLVARIEDNGQNSILPGRHPRSRRVRSRRRRWGSLGFISCAASRPAWITNAVMAAIGSRCGSSNRRYRRQSDPQ